MQAWAKNKDKNGLEILNKKKNLMTNFEVYTMNMIKIVGYEKGDLSMSNMMINMINYKKYDQGTKVQKYDPNINSSINFKKYQ